MPVAAATLTLQADAIVAYHISRQQRAERQALFLMPLKRATVRLKRHDSARKKPYFATSTMQDATRLLFIMAGLILSRLAAA